MSVFRIDKYVSGIEINGVRMPYNILAFLKMIDEPLDLNGSSSIFVLII